MKLSKIKEILKTKDLEPDWFEEKNGTTKEMKEKWAIQRIIEDEEFCLNCKTQNLVDYDLEGNLVMCTKCGEVTYVNDYIEKK